MSHAYVCGPTGFPRGGGLVSRQRPDVRAACNTTERSDRLTSANQAQDSSNFYCLQPSIFPVDLSLVKKDLNVPEPMIEQPPAWFLPALSEALSPIVQRLDAIEDRLGKIENRLGTLEADMKLVKAATHDQLEAERNLAAVRGAAR